MGGCGLTCHRSLIYSHCCDSSAAESSLMNNWGPVRTRVLMNVALLKIHQRVCLFAAWCRAQRTLWTQLAVMRAHSMYDILPRLKIWALWMYGGDAFVLLFIGCLLHMSFYNSWRSMYRAHTHPHSRCRFETPAHDVSLTHKSMGYNK